MSAGHHHNHHSNHSAADAEELKKYLASPDIKEFLKQDSAINTQRPIPLTGGSNLKGDTYYIDPDVPTHLRKYILRHEMVEKALRSVLGMKYDRAHHLATIAERLEVEADGMSWVAYNRIISKIVRANEKRGLEKMPKDFDTGPYQESGQMHLIGK